MRVKCVICDTVEELDDHILEAKRLRNRPIQTFMCINCHDRIANNTKKRVDSGNFIFRRSSHPVEKSF
ncbi:MAG TPA: YlaI family protein [Sporosarcina sp.]|nr:YlaI family protein [Sporosarcina sp.]